MEMSAPLKNTNDADAELASFLWRGKKLQDHIFCIVFYYVKMVQKHHLKDLKFPVSSFSSSPTTGTKACPRPVLLPLKPWQRERVNKGLHGGQVTWAEPYETAVGINPKKVTKNVSKNLLQEPILGVELSEEIKNPSTVKLIPEVQA